MCKYFIIDKDKFTVGSIKSTMEDFEEFQNIGVSDESDTAMNIVLKENPTLVFINIDNTLANPFKFVHDTNLYSNSPVEFIAISTHKNNAYEAIKMGFCDFLLSPITDLEIRKTLLNFQKKKLHKKKTSICLKSYKDYQYLQTDEILFLKADNNTTEFYMSDGSVINSYKTLKTFENRLPKEFMRIHKSYIINMNFVSRIQYGKSICSLRKNNHSVPFTSTYKETIENMNNALTQFTYSSSLN